MHVSYIMCKLKEFNASQLLADLQENIYSFLFQKKRKLFGIVAIESCIGKQVEKMLYLNAILAKLKSFILKTRKGSFLACFHFA